MDVMNTACTPHPQALHILFKHKRKVLNVFSDVIGINEIDHISIACITHSNEVIFLSHTPSIEYRLMASNLLPYDLLLTPHFYTNDHSKLWSELYHPEKYVELHAIKQAKERFTAGFSIPIKWHGIHLVYSFATKAPRAHSDLLLTRQDELINIGHYCFNKLSDLVLPHTQSQERTRQHLTLVVNNTRSIHHAAST